MPAAASPNLIDALRQLHLLEPAQLQELGHLQARCTTPHALTQELLKRDWLTAHQARLLLAGRGADLVLGPYVILDRVGEGGNGEVFKARHRTMHRIVALKLVRPELLADADVVGRFHREVEVLSQISHPNIVHAYDAGPIGSTFGLAMEYVEGVDLERLVQNGGKLQPFQALDYILQAARGLQHAHERGLIHRDIKPANLLVMAGHRPKSKVQGPKASATQSSSTAVIDSPFGLVKILDLGLARLQQPVQGSRTGNLTILGGNAVTLGTPDYMAPEQALDFHTVDTRADIYSLGCTFYFLLTGQPPFPGGSMAQKLMKHQQADPPPVQEFRADLPAGLPKVLQKMLAKRPPERYQTPGDVALALLAFERARSAEVAVQATKPELSSTTLAALPLPGTPPRKKQRRRWFVWFAASTLAALLLCAVGWLAVRPAPSPPTKPLGTSLAVVRPPTDQFALPAGELVTELSASSRKKYDLAVARVQASFRTDRAYKLTALSPGLEGGILVRTANDDKYNKADQLLTFTLSAPALVYVAYDKRGSTLPAWLADGTWQLTKEAVAGSDGDAQMSPIKVFARQFPPGRVTLGGNRQEPAKGADSNYLVIIKPAPG